MSARRLTPAWTTAAYRQLALLSRSGRVWILLAASVAPFLFFETMRLRSVARVGYEDLHGHFWLNLLTLAHVRRRGEDAPAGPPGCLLGGPEHNGACAGSTG